MIEKITYKTPTAERAVHNLKASVRKRVLTFNDIVPKASKELKAKKNYMQSDEFWKDEHNAKMTTLYDEMIKARDDIAEEIRLNNSDSRKFEMVQSGDGYARIKKFLVKNEKMGYSHKPPINGGANSSYKIVMTKIYNQSRDFWKLIGR